MLLQEYKHNNTNHFLYTKCAKDGSLMILLFYVDDMLLARSNIDELATFKSKLNDNFDMKDLGDVGHILDMCIVQNRDKKVLFLSQLEYVGKVLKHFNIEEGNALSALLLHM